MVQRENTGSGDPFFELKRSHRDYKVFDAHYERVGKVDELFVDDVDHPIYLGVSTGLFEGSSLLIPMDIVRINDKRGVVEVGAPRNRIENSPTLVPGDEVSREVEDKVRVYFGLAPLHSTIEDPGDHERRTTDDSLAFDERIDLVPGERDIAQERFEGAPPYRERDEQLLRNEEREAAEREADIRYADESRGVEGTLDETGRSESAAARIRRFTR